MVVSANNLPYGPFGQIPPGRLCVVGGQGLGLRVRVRVRFPCYPPVFTIPSIAVWASALRPHWKGVLRAV